MENINCLICGSSANSLYKKVVNRFDASEIFDIVKCQCDFIYLNPRPSVLEIGEYYESESYIPHRNSSSIYNFLQKIAFKWKYNKLINTKSVEDCRLLDFGSGSDKFLNYLSSMTNWDLYSYDPFINSKHPAIDFKNEKCDMITMWHSLEHVHDIDGAFDMINSVLNKNGFLFIAVPNVYALESNIFQSNWVAFDAPRHLYHFSEKDIKKLLSKYNFKVLKTYTLFQDTFFNVYSSFTINRILAFVISLLLLPFLLFMICLNSKYASSKLYVCSKK